MAHPPADISLTVEQVARMVAAQHPTLQGPLALVAHGWDNDLFRLGDDLAVRVPRRALAAGLIEHEQRWLPELARLLPVAVPTPVAVGRPDAGYPWSWSIVPWFAGRVSIDDPADERDAVAVQLADVLIALHRPAPADAPTNPYRGRPMAVRAEAMRERLAPHSVLQAAWSRGLAEPPWEGPDLWLHGDVHPGNLIVDGGRIAALVDFGDVTSGDPATDLSAAWLFFSPAGRARFRNRFGDRYDEATWNRARGWAAAFAGAVVDAPDDGLGAVGRHAAHQIGAEA